MTRKDYEKFAEMVELAGERFDTAPESDVVRYFTNRIADIFAADNPCFNRERFHKACEVKREA